MPTTSPSMDIQVSSNFERYLFEASDRDAAWVRGRMGALAQSGRFELSDDGSRRHARRFRRRYRHRWTRSPPASGASRRDSGYLLDPHTACGVVAARQDESPCAAAPHVVLATAHPAKFPDAMAGDHRRAPRAAAAPALADDRPGAHHGAAQRPRRRAALRRRARRAQRREPPHEQARNTELANGLRVVSHRMPHLETVSMGMWVGVGARHETVAQQGISHLLEHMAFKGTQAAQRQGHRRGDRGGRRRAQCRHQPGDHRLFRARACRRHRPRASISWPTSCKPAPCRRRSWSANAR